MPGPRGSSAEKIDVFAKDPGIPPEYARDGASPFYGTRSGGTGGGGNILALLGRIFGFGGGGGGGGNTSPYASGQAPGQPPYANADPYPAPQGEGFNMDWQDILRQLQGLTPTSGSPGGGATPGAYPVSGGAGLNTNVNPTDFSRFIPGYGAQPAQDLSQLYALAGQAPNTGGVGGGGFGGGGGGGAGAQGGAVGSAQALLNALFSGGAPQFDPALMGQIQGLQGSSASMYQQFPGMIGGAQDPIMALILQELAGGQQGGYNFVGGGGGGGAGGGLSSPDISLRGISPEAQGLIDQMTRARTGELDLARRGASGSATADLFGRGVPRSSIALDQMGRLQYGHEQALQQALASGSEQTLGAMLADQQARVSHGNARLSAEAQLGAASASAGASAAAAGFAAQSDAVRARLGLLGSIFGDRSSALASAFGATQGANTGFAGVLGDIGLGQLGAAGDRANTAQSVLDSQNRLRASLFGSSSSANAQIQSARIGQQTALAGLPFDQQLRAQQFEQSEAARMQKGIFDLLGIDLNRYLGDQDARTRIEAARLGKPQEASWLDKFLGVAGTLGAGYLAGRG